MKKSLILMALLTQGLFTNFAQATTFYITAATNQPANLPALANAIVPMLKLSVAENDKQFPPPLYLVVQQMNSLWSGLDNPIVGLYLGDTEKTISWGPFTCPYQGATLVGPIHLQKGVTNNVFVLAQFASNLRAMQNDLVRLEVVGASVDGSETETSDNVVFDSSFPIVGADHMIKTSPAVGTLSIRNLNQPATVYRNAGRVTLAQFEAVVENETVTAPFLGLTFSLTSGNAADITAVTVEDQNGKIIVGPQDVRPFDKFSGGDIFTNTDVVFPVGTNHYTVKGILANTIPDGAEVFTSWEWFGAATDSIGYGILPDMSQGVTLGIHIRARETGYAFITNTGIGSEGYDVLMLQHILGIWPEMSTDSASSVTNYFGERTKAAVIQFQIDNGIPGTGFVGPLTRAKLNSLGDTYEWPSLLALTTIPVVWNGLRETTLTVSAKPSTQYGIEQSNDLHSWRPFGYVATDTSGNATYRMNTESAGNSFFRLVHPSSN